MDYKNALGAVATAIALLGYLPYFRDILIGRTKPHAFSWLVWGSLASIAFAGQVTKGAGPGAWVTGVTPFVSLVVFIVALRVGEKNIVLADYLGLTGAGAALVLWFITKDPLLSLILIPVIDALGFFPTFRKSFHKPYEETLATYTLSCLKFVLALIALRSYTVTTWLYPASLILTNGAFVTMLLIRRKQVD